MKRIASASFRAAVAGIAISMLPCGKAASIGDLGKTFLPPPSSAKPAIWWFWGESVTTDHGITQDLDALKRVGFGGVVGYEQLFTDRPAALKSLSPEWLALFRFAAAECARFGLTLAAVKLNGRDLGVLWKEPFAIDVTEELQTGRNELEVRVVNTWINRIIGDVALPEDQRITWATWSPFKPGDALQPSGLMGPEQLRISPNQ